MELAVLILRDLLEYSCQIPELARDIGTNHIPGLLTSLLALKPECQISTLEGSKACMLFYPRACGSLRGKLAAYFLARVDAETPHLQQLACDCYALLPSLGAGFTQGLKYTECWGQQAHCLLATLHSLLGTLYEGAETDPLHYEGPGVEILLPTPEDGEVNFILHLKHRFSGLAKCLCQMLSNDFVAPVSVPVQDILDLVCRALNISTKNISWFGDGPLRMLLLPSVHLEALDLLSALILACGPRLVRFGATFCRLFPQVLTTWSSGRDLFPPGQERPYSAVRTRLYEVLDLWVQTAGAACGILQGPRTQSEALLGHLISDISPPADTLKMRDSRPASDLKPSAPKKPKLSDLGTLGSLHPKQDSQANSSTCLAALRGLSRAVLLTGSLMKEQVHKRLQELVVPLLIRLAQAETPPGSPYASAPCRRELHRLLLALVLAPPPSWPPPFHCALRLFSQGRTDPNLQVSSFCTEALAVCNALLHPRVPSLQLPLAAPPGGPQAPPPGPSELSPALASPFRPAPPAPFSAPRLLLPPPASSAANPLGLPPPGLASPAQLPPRLAPEEPSLPTSPGAAEAALGAKLRRSVFVHYDKEEEEDVEISLESDSDDSVVIVPKGQLGKGPGSAMVVAATAAQVPTPPAPPPAPPAPPSPPPTSEETPPEPLAPPLSLGVPLPPAPAAVLALPASPSPAAMDPPFPALVEEDPTVININSSEEEEDDEDDYPEDEEYFEEDEEEEEEYDEEDEEFGEDLEEEEDEEFDEEEGLTEEEEDEEEGLTEEEEEEEEEEGEEERRVLPSLPPPLPPHRSDEEPPELLPIKDEPPKLEEEEEEENEDEEAAAGLLMEVDEEAFHPPEEMAEEEEEGGRLERDPGKAEGQASPLRTAEGQPPLPSAAPLPSVKLEEEQGEKQPPQEEQEGPVAAAAPRTTTPQGQEEEEEEEVVVHEGGRREPGGAAPEAAVLRAESEKQEPPLGEEGTEVDETEAMLADFVDCPPDEEKVPSEPSS
ncbi:proline-, glutamic acid- and leucine-rich protein 1 [Podarcis raffonei]|uniref:proline-, glutamic acid- and leucine-rich protein 1 n=1 Tax=Podarcis raffonei TaxID=65483 RepID=UPI0023290E6A|nr:proline-, glutamic acid- and leucine-rich protein 1 [Podarcis raffonei]